MWRGLCIYWCLLRSNPPPGSTMCPAFNLHSPSFFSFPVALRPLALSFTVLRAHSPDALPIPISNPDGFLLNSPSPSTCLTPALTQEEGGVYWGIVAVCCLFPLTLSSTGRTGGGDARGHSGRRIWPSDHPWCGSCSCWSLPMHSE